MRAPPRLLVLAAFFAALSALNLSAQTFRGTLLGTVADSTGAVIPDAAISVKNMDTGIERTTESNSDGAFNVPELPIGRYTVTATKTGFTPYHAEGINIEVASQANLSITLQTGVQKEEVIVSGTALQVDTTSNTLGATLTTNDVKNLPVYSLLSPGRSSFKLYLLDPF